MKKITYNREEEYEGHNNEKIISLVNDLNDSINEQRRIDIEIKDIQDNCDHEYMFVCTGMYKDTYACKKCGHYTEK
jgi:hypothetical protein